MPIRNMRALVGVAMIVLTTGAAFCQSAGKLPEFEVASIKPAPPPKDGNLFIRRSNDPGRIDFNNITLRDMIREAYQVKDYQISGPDWMGSPRWNVVAKLPANSSREQIPQMWQSLLAERFKLTLHRDKKELPVYVLMVAKNGPKLKEAENAEVPAPPGGGGFPGQRLGMIEFGRGSLNLKASPIGRFVDLLSRQMDRPIVDQTELTGFYDISLKWTPDERQRMTLMPGGGPPPGAEERAHPGGPDGAQPSGPNIFAAVQEQLGLKMEAKKAPVEILVIDHVEKTPTEN